MINNNSSKKIRIKQKFYFFLVHGLLGHGENSGEPELLSRMSLKLQYHCLKKKFWQLILIAMHISVPVTNDF